MRSYAKNHKGKKRRLNKDNLCTIGDLLDAKSKDPSRVSLVWNALNDFEANRRRHQHQQAILQLKQHCVCLDYELPHLTKE